MERVLANGWIHKNIDEDLRHPQQDIKYSGMPHLVHNYMTNIKAIDLAVKSLYEKGYIHSHLRMYVASLITNIAKYHWKTYKMDVLLFKRCRLGF